MWLGKYLSHLGSSNNKDDGTLLFGVFPTKVQSQSLSLTTHSSIISSNQLFLFISFLVHHLYLRVCLHLYRSLSISILCLKSHIMRAEITNYLYFRWLADEPYQRTYRDGANFELFSTKGEFAVHVYDFGTKVGSSKRFRLDYLHEKAIYKMTVDFAIYRQFFAIHIDVLKSVAVAAAKKTAKAPTRLSQRTKRSNEKSKAKKLTKSRLSNNNRNESCVIEKQQQCIHTSGSYSDPMTVIVSPHSFCQEVLEVQLQ
jgi:hypothetical protein